MNGSDDPHDRVSRARNLTSTADMLRLYRDWAASYDDDVFGKLAFFGSSRVAELLAAHVNPADCAAVLDAGCGTGAVGEALRSHEFAVIDGIDLSTDMLQQARKKAVYRNLEIADLNQPIAGVDAPYAAIVSAGTFTHGHVGARGLVNLTACLAPAGVMCLAVAEAIYVRDRFAETICRLGLTAIFDEREAVRRGGDAETRMLVLTGG